MNPMMKPFRVYQQLYPRCIGLDEKGEDLYEARIEEVATLQAPNSSAAIKAARRLPVFLNGKGLGKFPICKLVETS